MIIEQAALWESGSNAYFVKYLLDNTAEIDLQKRHPAMIICPGGGYFYTSDREAEPVALEYLREGFQIFVLRYTTQDIGECRFPQSLYDLAKMILTVRQNADLWLIDPDKIAICGFSAGGNLCAELAVYWKSELLASKFRVESYLLKPNAVVLAYALLDYAYQIGEMSHQADASTILPKHNMSMIDFMKKSAEILLGEYIPERLPEISPCFHVNTHTPPTFLWHTTEDRLVYPGNSLRFASMLQEKGVPYELHIFEKGEHGLALANKITAQSDKEIDSDAAQWVDLSVRFLRRHFG